jgi:ArsR family transcriptional regulator
MDALVEEVTISADEMAENARSACEFLKAMSHETRLRVLCHLMEGEKSVSELENVLGIRQASVSQQLQRLRAEKMVSTRRDGKAVYYSISSHEAREVISVLYKLFCAGDKC